MTARYSCSHMTRVSNIPIQDIVKAKESSTCSDCSCYGPNLWICLYHDCLQIGCSEKFNDHSTLHNRNCPSHCIHMNLSTQRIWCYICQTEVFMDVKNKQQSQRNIIYNDSDDENRGYDRESYDSGRGSYTTLRTDSIERRASKTASSSITESNQVFAFDKTVGLNVGMSGDSAGDSSDTDEDGSGSNRTRGLVGLQNIGNTCYMNAALQALSNTPPLTAYFLDCAGAVKLASEGRKPGISRSYQRLIKDMWHRKTRGYVVPSGILYGIRNVHSMFRGYHQHDTQEFLRCFMDQLHEELKQVEPSEQHVGQLLAANASSGSCDTLDNYSLAAEGGVNCSSNNNEQMDGNSGSTSQSEGEYETCDSGVSERSSLSDDTERSSDNNRRSSTAKRRLSRSGSPGRTARLRSKLTTVSYQQHQRNTIVVEQQPGVSSSSTSSGTSNTNATINNNNNNNNNNRNIFLYDKYTKVLKIIFNQDINIYSSYLTIYKP